jgi:hypothetical protein
MTPVRRSAALVVDTCPTCGNTDLRAAEERGDTVFHCAACTSSWRYALGYLWRVDRAAACPRPVRPARPARPGRTTGNAGPSPLAASPS